MSCFLHIFLVFFVGFFAKFINMLIMQIPSILTKNLFEIFCRGILMGQIKPNINGMILLGFPFQEIY